MTAIQIGAIVMGLVLSMAVLAMGGLMVTMTREAYKERSWGFVIRGLLMTMVCLISAVAAPMNLYLMASR